MKQFQTVVLSFLFLSVLGLMVFPQALIPKVYAFSGLNGEFGNWVWDGTNKIMTIVKNATANAGDTEAHAFSFMDIVNATNFYGWSAEYNISNSGTQFEFNFRIVLGDGSGQTWFADSSKQVVWLSTVPNPIINVEWNSRFRLGILEDATAKRTSRGCSLFSLNSADNLALIYNQGGAFIYSSQFYKAGAIARISGWGYLTRIWNTLSMFNVVMAPENGDIFNTITEKLVSEAIEALTSTSTYSRVFATDIRSLVYSASASIWTVADAYVRGATYITTMEDWTGTGYLVNVDSDSWATNWIGTSTGEIYRKYTFDLIATYPNGTAMQNANVTISNAIQGKISSFLTFANGSIPTQTLTMGYYNQTGGNTIYSYNPYHINATSQDGTYIYYKSWTLNAKANWEIALLPISTLVNTSNYMLIGSLFSAPIMLAFALAYRKKHKP